MNTTAESTETQASFQERELQEMFKTLQQIQEQTNPSSKVRFLRVLAGQAQVYAARIEAHES